jgi:hypothetical protein
MNRINRELETRQAQSRAHSSIPQYNMEWTNPLDFPSGAIRDGYIGKWVNTEIRGMATNRVNAHAMLGWSLVPSERCPGFSDLKDPLKRNPLSQHYLCMQDVVAMEIPDQKYYAYKQSIQNHNDQIMHSLSEAGVNEYGVQRVVRNG